MKNALIVIAAIFVFLISYFLQANFFSWFTIAGVAPNLFVILVLFLGLFGGKRLGAPMGIFLGLCLDLFINKKVGISAIMLGIVGGMGGILDKNFSKNSRMTIIVMTIGVTTFYEVGMYIMNHFVIGTTIEIIPFMKILLIENLYNVILTIILYPLLQRAGYYMEDSFKGNQILTRYF